MAGALLSAYVRRFQGTPSWPVYTKELDFRVKQGYVRYYDIQKLYNDFEELSTRHNIITNGGRDFLHTQGYNTSAPATVALKYVAVSSSTYTPAAGDTTLSSEIVDANGLARAVTDNYSHTAGTNQTTVGKTYTATGAYTAVQLAALFNAASSGTMANEATFSATSLASGDQLQLTYTITLG